MKKILAFTLICMMLFSSALARPMLCPGGNGLCSLPTLTPMTTACPMTEGECAMGDACPMTEGECPMETCPYMVDGVCTATQEQDCPCGNYGIATTEEPVYLLPESDIRLIDKSELEGVDMETLALMRNEILARHGYPFVKEKYQEYFGSQSWYTVNPDFDYNMLSAIEMANVETIKALEAAK